MTETEFTDRPTKALINLENLAYNFKSIKSFVGEDTLYMAVVKADAYGHGASACAVRLEECGVDWFGVALLEEAFELRKAGIAKPILCFGGVWPGQEAAMLDLNIVPVIFDIEQALRLSRSAVEMRRTATVHIKIDTGMGRVGIPANNIPEFIREFLEIPNLKFAGLMTHFAAADDPGEAEFTRGQIEVFHNAIQAFEDAGMRPDIIDMANSPGAVAFPESKGNMVRIGGLLYGLGSDVLPKGIPKPDLRPVMSLESRIAQIKRVPPGTTLGYGRSFETDRDSVIGTVPAGYHDGYRRVFSNKARVIVNGRLTPVVGRISMDWTIIDLTDVPGVQVGDRVLLLGEDRGVSVTAEDLASAAGTITYEITCGISKRVPRVFL